MPAFAPLRVSKVALLTTYRRSGDPVATPVSIAVDGDNAYFVAPSDTYKVKRLARDPRVTLAPCTPKGRVLGETVPGRARLLEGDERRRQRRLFRPGKGLVSSYLMYRVRGKSLNLYEVVPETR